MLFDWFVQEGWVVCIAGLILLLQVRSQFWMQKEALRWRQTESMYRALMEKHTGSFKTLDRMKHGYEQQTMELRRLTQEFSDQVDIQDIVEDEEEYDDNDSLSDTRIRGKKKKRRKSK